MWRNVYEFWTNFRGFTAPVFLCYHMYKASLASLEKAMATHYSTLAWKIPWTEEPGRLQSMESRRVGHDRVASLSLFTFMHWRRKMATHSSLLPWRIPGTEEPGGLLSMGSHRVGYDWSDLAAAAAAAAAFQRMRDIAKRDTGHPSSPDIYTSPVKNR